MGRINGNISVFTIGHFSQNERNEVCRLIENHESLSSFFSVRRSYARFKMEAGLRYEFLNTLVGNLDLKFCKELLFGVSRLGSVLELSVAWNVSVIWC